LFKDRLGLDDDIRGYDQSIIYAFIYTD